MTELDKFLQECNSVCAGVTKEITGLRARSERTGLSLKNIKLVAQAASVQVIKDGKELKVVAY